MEKDDLLLMSKRPQVKTVPMNYPSFSEGLLETAFTPRYKKIVFVVSGYDSVGMGHVYRALSLAKELRAHDVNFVCTYPSQLAKSYLDKFSQKVYRLKKSEQIETIVRAINPDMVINDLLNTTEDYILTLKELKIKVINFEDEGSGAKFADFVINALYEKNISENCVAGYRYFELRDEFLTAPKRPIKEVVGNILLTLGGADVNNLTLRLIKLLLPIAEKNNFKLTIITGLGYAYDDELADYIENCDIKSKNLILWIRSGTQKIADFMLDSDITICSCGRTPYELASLGIPTIAIATNQRETEHKFPHNIGMHYLGRHDQVSDHAIQQSLCNLLNFKERITMRQKLDQINLINGKKNVMNIIEKILHN